ncbi:hypothetical protein [Alkaliphilus pronyensis]|uniref:hypothetical protein n=1 Tax=Alkaliphilus pronyensis TaxID=1482732 RepID=UPI0018657B71|nr:hypothetical protein [Alkaliphilus pronyensis]
MKKSTNLKKVVDKFNELTKGMTSEEVKKTIELIERGIIENQSNSLWLFFARGNSSLL